MTESERFYWDCEIKPKKKLEINSIFWADYDEPVFDKEEVQEDAMNRYFENASDDIEELCEDFLENWKAECERVYY